VRFVVYSLSPEKPAVLQLLVNCNLTLLTIPAMMQTNGIPG
jgi:hypothetical protein